VVEGVKPGKVVLLAVLAALGLAVLACGGVALWGASLFAEGDYSSVAIARAEVPRVFGVTVPTGATGFLGKNGGFQDWIGHVIFRLPDGSLDAWLAENHLGRDALVQHRSPDLTEAIGEIEHGHSPRGALTITELSGITDTTVEDGGTNTYRKGLLLEWQDQVWVFLEAFGT
jgi:hypothetical protein